MLVGRNALRHGLNRGRRSGNRHDFRLSRAPGAECQEVRVAAAGHHRNVAQLRQVRAPRYAHDRAGVDDLAQQIIPQPGAGQQPRGPFARADVAQLAGRRQRSLILPHAGQSPGNPVLDEHEPRCPRPSLGLVLANGQELRKRHLWCGPMTGQIVDIVAAHPRAEHREPGLATPVRVVNARPDLPGVIAEEKCLSDRRDDHRAYRRPAGDLNALIQRLANQRPPSRRIELHPAPLRRRIQRQRDRRPGRPRRIVRRDPCLDGGPADVQPENAAHETRTRSAGASFPLFILYPAPASSTPNGVWLACRACHGQGTWPRPHDRHSRECGNPVNTPLQKNFHSRRSLARAKIPPIREAFSPRESGGRTRTWSAKCPQP